MRLIKVMLRQKDKVVITQSIVRKTITPISSVRRRYLLLGKEYSVELNKGERNSMRIEDTVFKVTLREMSRENFETFMENWYRRTARKYFEQSIAKYPQANNAPQIKVYKMTRAWGRCYYQKGIITLNLHLVKTPPECIDYIVLHELCHFTHHNHSRSFHNMVESLDPQWRTKDSLLKEFLRTRPTILQKLHI